MFEEGREAMKNEELGSKLKELIKHSNSESRKYIMKECVEELNQLLEYKEKCEEYESRPQWGCLENEALKKEILRLKSENKELKEQLEKGKSNEQYKKTDPLRRRNL